MRFAKDGVVLASLQGLGLQDKHRQCRMMQVYQQIVVSNNAIWALGSGLLSK